MTAAFAPSPTLAQAYAHCERLTREAARNFHYGIRLLPADKRTALCAVYAFARRLDDIGDGDLPAADKISGLAAARADLAALGAQARDPVLAALDDAARRFPIPLGAFLELADGVEMDLRGTTYDTFEELVVYCRRVAGTVGRLSLGIFGASDACAPQLADTLGIALQQTNILRDVREDLLDGRVYLPREDLDRYGVRLTLDSGGRLGGPPASLVALLRSDAIRAAAWYDRGLRLLDLLDRRDAACCGAMAGIYLRLNRRIVADPEPLLDRRLSLSGWEKGGVALRSIVAGRPR